MPKMTSWSNEQQQYMMQSMMGMNPMMPNMMPPGNIPPLMPPMYGPPPGTTAPYGVPPPTDKSADDKLKDQSRDPRIDNKDHGKQRDFAVKRPNQQDNDQNNKNNRSNKPKKSKWDSGGNEQNWPSQQSNNSSMAGAGMYAQGPGNMIMPPNMMPYAASTPLLPPPMDMTAMPNMPGVMPPMPNMMPGMNMMMMNQPMPNVDNQAIYVGNAALLPPLPNVSLPARSEKPSECKTIFVGGFPSNVTKEIINEMFIRFGSIADIKLNKQGVAQVMFDNAESVEPAFFFSGSRFRYINQMDSEASTIYIDYAGTSGEQQDHENNTLPSSGPIEPCTPAAIITLYEKIKSVTEFVEVAPTLEGWLQRGDCNKKNGNSFYSLIQTANGHLRRIYDEKMKIDEEYCSMKINLKEKFAALIKQLELVAKIMTAAKHQRVLECFSRQQKKNIEMWLKMTEEVSQFRDEFQSMFDDEDPEHANKKTVAADKYEELKKENEKLRCEMEGYKNEASLAKEEVERKMEKLKSQYTAQLQQMSAQIYPPLPPPPPKMVEPPLPTKPEPPADDVSPSPQSVSVSEAKIISAVTAYLMIHPSGAVVDHIVPYVKITCPFVTQGTVNHVLQKYSDVFMKKKYGKGVSGEYRWVYAMFERVKSEYK